MVRLIRSLSCHVRAVTTPRSFAGRIAAHFAAAAVLSAPPRRGAYASAQQSGSPGLRSENRMVILRAVSIAELAAHSPHAEWAPGRSCITTRSEWLALQRK